MIGKELTLKGLEVFKAVARTGSVQTVAGEIGLSVSTVSHHLKTLEDRLGVALLDHGRRPMVLTPAGAMFLHHVEESLRSLRQGEIELTSGSLGEVRNLRLGLVDDFDGEIAPELAKMLAGLMPKCIFRHKTRPSHEILALLAEHKLDIAVATRPPNEIPGLLEYPLLRDPFVVAIPATSSLCVEEFIAGRADLPFLRYPHSQMIGSQIETNLRRRRLVYEKRYELESNQMLLAMVAGGAGWAITTAASYMRARGIHKDITLGPFPVKGFERTISLFTTEPYVRSVPRMIHTVLRRLIRQRILEPAISDMPWLASAFLMLDTAETDAGDGDMARPPGSGSGEPDALFRTPPAHAQ